MNGFTRLLTAIVAVWTCGCVVPKAQWKAANDRAADYQNQLAQANAKCAALKLDADKFEDQLTNYEKQLAASREVEDILEKRVENLKLEGERLHGEVAAAIMTSAPSRVIVASNRVGAGKEDVDLPPELSQALATVAGRYEGIAFDPVDRALRMQTEIAFVGGGDRLRPEARTALREIADALVQPPSKRLIFQIVGHTWGEQQVTRDLMASHPTDWHLAAHQALAVEECLEARGVNPVRMGVVSYGSQQPLVEGKDDVAHRKNARIEIFFVPEPKQR